MDALLAIMVFVFTIVAVSVNGYTSWTLALVINDRLARQGTELTTLAVKGLFVTIWLSSLLTCYGIAFAIVSYLR